MESPKYKTRFFADAKVLDADDRLRREAFASLKELQSLMPADFNPESEPDLLYIASPLVLVGKSNLNGDCLTKEQAIASYKRFAKKLLDIEHNREKIVGNIFNVALTEVGTNRVLTEEEAFNQEFFNISYAAYIWKVANPKLAEFLTMSSKENSPYFNSVSSSFEVGFDDYDIAVGSLNVASASIVSSDKMEKYEKFLSANGGKGVDEDGNCVYRVLKGKVVPLGAGLVSKPASQVKGVLTMEKLMANIDETQTLADEEYADIMQKLKAALESEEKTFTMTRKDGSLIKATFSDDNEEQPEVQIAASVVAEDKILLKNNIQTKNDGVITNTAKPMKITKLEDIAANSAELFKNEAYAMDIAKIIADETAKISEKYVKQLKEREDASTFLSEAKASAEAKAKELEAKAAELEAKVTELAAALNKIEEAKAAEVAERLFQERMSGLDAEFDLDDEARAFITEDIKGMTEEAYVVYAKKAKALFKKKGDKGGKFNDDKKQKNDNDADDGKPFNDSKGTDDTSANLKEIVAAAKPDATQTALPNNLTSTATETLAERMKRAFSSETMTVNGRAIK